VISTWSDIIDEIALLCTCVECY